MEVFYKRLNRLRLSRNLRVNEVAEFLGVASSTYRDWEYGRSIRGEPYVMLSELFEVSLEELMTGKKATPLAIQKELGRCEEALKNLKKELESFF